MCFSPLYYKCRGNAWLTNTALIDSDKGRVMIGTWRVRKSSTSSLMNLLKYIQCGLVSSNIIGTLSKSIKVIT